MIKLKRNVGNWPKKEHSIYGPQGKKIKFDAEGVAEIDETLADMMEEVPGYEVIRPEPPKPDEEEIIEDLEAFKMLQWQKQREYVEKDRVSDEILSDILANGEDYTPTVIKAAEKKVG